MARGWPTALVVAAGLGALPLATALARPPSAELAAGVGLGWSQHRDAALSPATYAGVVAPVSLSWSRQRPVSERSWTVRWDGATGRGYPSSPEGLAHHTVSLRGSWRHRVGPLCGRGWTAALGLGSQVQLTWRRSVTTGSRTADGLASIEVTARVRRHLGQRVELDLVVAVPVVGLVSRPDYAHGSDAARLLDAKGTLGGLEPAALSPLGPLAGGHGHLTATVDLGHRTAVRGGVRLDATVLEGTSSSLQFGPTATLAALRRF